MRETFTSVVPVLYLSAYNARVPHLSSGANVLLTQHEGASSERGE